MPEHSESVRIISGRVDNNNKDRETSVIMETDSEMVKNVQTPVGEYSPHSTVLSTPPPNNNNRKNVDDSASTSTDSSPTSSSSTSSSTCTSYLSSEEATAAPRFHGTKQLKRCLTIILKLAISISHDHGERVLNHIANLLAGLMTAEEFHRQINQDLRLPLRSFVFPLLQKQVPIWQRDISILSRESQQTTTQYVKHQFKSLLDCSESTADIWEIFQTEISQTRKRRASASIVDESGATETSPALTTTPKRAHVSLYSEPFGSCTSLWIPPKVMSQRYHPIDNAGSSTAGNRATATNNNNNINSCHRPESGRSYNNSFYSAKSPPPSQSALPASYDGVQVKHQQNDGEWTNIHTMLNCILSMVEKTRKALSILQQRAATSEDNVGAELMQSHRNLIKRRGGSNQEITYEACELRRQAGELIAQTLRATEDRVSDVKRRAEEAVQDVKRTAMAELQRALAAERLRSERLAAEARRQGAEETLLALGGHNQIKETCWNCGRRANETCSGCNTARYCSTFCQHKHWEIHHKVCGGRTSSSQACVINGDTKDTDKTAKSGEHSRTDSPPAPTTKKSPSPTQGPYGSIVN